MYGNWKINRFYSIKLQWSEKLCFDCVFDGFARHTHTCTHTHHFNMCLQTGRMHFNGGLPGKNEKKERKQPIEWLIWSISIICKWLVQVQFKYPPNSNATVWHSLHSICPSNRMISGGKNFIVCSICLKFHFDVQLWPTNLFDFWNRFYSDAQ